MNLHIHSQTVEVWNGYMFTSIMTHSACYSTAQFTMLQIKHIVYVHTFCDNIAWWRRVFMDFSHSTSLAFIQRKMFDALTQKHTRDYNWMAYRPVQGCAKLNSAHYWFKSMLCWRLTSCGNGSFSCSTDTRNMVHYRKTSNISRTLGNKSVDNSE